MKNRPTPITDLLVSVVGPEAHASAPGRRPGGEWDAWRALPARSRRRLIGAGWARAGAMPPDVLADYIAARIDVADPLDWYYRTALMSIAERRTSAQTDSRRRLAERFEHPTHYAYRTALVNEIGYRSLWHYRQEKGWT